MKKIYTLISSCLLCYSLSAQNGEWTWMSGDNTVNQQGNYGHQRAPEPKPGARYSSISWTQGNDLWLFGGGYKDEVMNDLWHINTTSGEWDWLSGADYFNQAGKYISMGKPDPANMPGARRSAVSWTDASGNFWLFGGTGYDLETRGLLNDLWKYDPSTKLWAWMSTDKVRNIPGVYGSLGEPSPRNKPGAREGAVSWVDASGDLWLFGGNGYASSSNTVGFLNDLWKYEIKSQHWTWINGDSKVNQPGVYKSKYSANPNNKPGSRSFAISWTDANGNFWLFGGNGYDEKSTGALNDLWKYDPKANEWTWVSGDNLVNQVGVYGKQGVADKSNNPGARYASVGWMDQSGNLWLFGGSGPEKEANLYSDLWKYDPAMNIWTWVNGYDQPNRPGIYGTKGEPYPKNIPGARSGSISWTDKSDKFWLFGGFGYDARISSHLNDLWKFEQTVVLSCPSSVSVSTDLFNCSAIVQNIDPIFSPAGNSQVNYKLSGATIGEGSKTASGQRFKKGVTTVSYSVVNDNKQSCSFTVTVKDTTRPVPLQDTLPEITGECSVSVTTVPKAKDYCADLISGVTKDSLRYTTPGTYTITWTYDDRNGNIVTQKQRVIVFAAAGKPVPDIPNLPDIKGVCSATVTTRPTAKLPCGGKDTATTKDSLTYTTQGTHIITWSYGTGNNIVTQKQNMIVSDTTAPVPDVKTLPDITGDCSVEVRAIPTASDNCTKTISGKTMDPTKYSTRGTHTITWNYDDGHGNTISQKQNLIVLADAGRPIPDIPNLPDIKGECSSTITTRPTAKLPCGGKDTATTKDSLTYVTQGTHIITWTYGDGNNIVTQQQRVMVKDSTAPVPDIKTLPDITGDCSVEVITIPTASDNCTKTINGKTTDPTKYSTTGTHTITWTYDDGHGNTISQKQNLIVLADAGRPVPDIPNLPDIKGECSATITTRPTAKLPCGGKDTATTKDSLSYTTQGIHIITWTYGDGNNIVTQQQRVIVKDSTAPVPDVKTLPDVTGECSVEVTTIPTATDNCSKIIFGKTKDSTKYTAQGTYAITWIYEDGNGNAFSQKQNLILLPASGKLVPDVTSLPDIKGECSVSVTTRPTASKNCGGHVNGITNDPLVYTVQGTYTINWTYSDGNNSIIQKQRVIVQDITAPVPDVTSLPDITGDCSVEARSIPTASDNCNKTIMGKTTDPTKYSAQGIHTITWIYDDGHGNIYSQEQNLIVLASDGKPVPDLPDLPDIKGECSASVTMKPTATKNCGDQVTGTTNDPLTYNAQGNYIITWTYGQGQNSTIQKQQVIVKDNTPPVPDNPFLPDLTGECSVEVSTIPTATDNCTKTITGKTKDATKYTTPGTYTINWTYDDGHGNTFSQKQKLAVLPTSGKLVPDVANLPDIKGECSVSITTKPTASKSCGGHITGSTNDPLTYTAQGVYAITWKYDDGTNSITQKQNVIVKDDTAPVPDLPSLPDLSGDCSLEVKARPTATDNCSGTIIGTTNDPFIYYTQGSYTITWSYSDGSGNIATQKQLVIIKNSSVPVPALAELPDLTGECSVVVTQFPQASTPCGKIITGTTSDSLSYQSTGTYTITWKYTESNGNTISQQQHVIVKDKTAPVPVRIVLPDITGECSVNISARPMAIDNCAGVIAATTNDPLSYNVQGNYTITWQYDDGNGNIVSQKQHVIVKNLVLKVDAFPNPSNNQFTVIVRSCNTTDKVIMRIYDVLGRLVESPKDIRLGEKVYIGVNYASASYFVQVIQGKEIVMVKLLKLH